MLTENELNELNEFLEARGVRYERVKGVDQLMLPGDLAEHPQHPINWYIMRDTDDDAQTVRDVGDISYRGINSLLRPQAIDSPKAKELREALRWAWMHLPRISEDMFELSEKLQEARDLLDDPLIRESEYDSSDEPDPDDPNDE